MIPRRRCRPPTEGFHSPLRVNVHIHIRRLTPFSLSPKLQVQMVKMADLRQHLPRDCLPQHLGGLLPLESYSWNQQLLAGQNGRVDPVDELVGIPVEDPSIHVPGAESMRPQELLTHLGRLQRSGVHQEYEELRKEPPPGSFHCAQ